MDQLKLAWLAGLIDGEGCLYGLHKTSQHASKASADNRIEIKLEIHSASSRMIDAVSDILDTAGIVCHREKPKHQPLSTRPAHRLRVINKCALRDLLKLLLPYLVVKRPEAELVLSFLERQCAVSRYRMQPADLEMIAQLKALKRVS